MIQVQSEPTQSPDEITDRTRRTLLNTRYATLASNTIDYWMLPEDEGIEEDHVVRAIESAPVHEDATLQIYVHVPFCAQRCRFCAFSGGNSLDLREAERYARLVVMQLQDLLDRTQIKGHPIRSVNIGGGSPDLLGASVGWVLKAMRELPGCSDDTEFSVEFTLSTTGPEFIEELVRYDVTKASFGIQSLDAEVRRAMRQPRSLRALDRVLEWIDGRIPIINADLITGMPGQDLMIAARDLQVLMSDERINAISSYLLTPGAAPSLIAGLESGELPPMPSPPEQALMRLHTYSTFLRAGWIRRGTNTYFDPSRIAPEILERIAGNECIGASHYEAFLLAAGPQAVSSLPGVRVENRVDIDGWCRALEEGRHPFHLPKCAVTPQTDTALWVFPLRWEGLPQDRLDRMRAEGALSDEQLRTLHAFEREGLVTRTDGGYQLSILGEVFMGHLVRDLKQEQGRQAVDAYIDEGLALGRAISRGVACDQNETNNRQIALPILNGGAG
ncbi:MAG: radical SAM protein [Planctomycetota bacterium]